MKIAISLDTQAVITQPAPVRVKAASFVAVEVSLTRASQPVRLPDGASLEFALKPQGQWTGDLLVYHSAFAIAAGSHYNGTVNFATSALLNALGLDDTDPGNDGGQLEASGEITWSFGGQKFRSATFPVIVEPPLTDASPVPSPDPQTYPAPQDIELLSQKGAPGGYAPLDADGHVPKANLPATAIADVTGLSGALDEKADSSVVADLQTGLNSKADSAVVSGLQDALGGKADNDVVSALQASLNSKAESAAVTALQSALSSKADETEVSALQSALSGKADSSTVSSLQTAVNSKADAAVVAALQTALNNKADKAILNPDDGKRYRITVTGNPPEIGVEEIP